MEEIIVPRDELIIIEGSPVGPRRTDVRGWREAGLAILDNRTPEQRNRPIERPYLSAEDWASKRYAEEYVARQGRTGIIRWETPWDREYVADWRI
jgi:hypothetical protein